MGPCESGPTASIRQASMVMSWVAEQNATIMANQTSASKAVDGLLFAIISKPAMTPPCYLVGRRLIRKLWTGAAGSKNMCKVYIGAGTPR